MSNFPTSWLNALWYSLFLSSIWRVLQGSCLRQPFLVCAGCQPLLTKLQPHHRKLYTSVLRRPCHIPQATRWPCKSVSTSPYTRKMSCFEEHRWHVWSLGVWCVCRRNKHWDVLWIRALNHEFQWQHAFRITMLLAVSIINDTAVGMYRANSVIMVDEYWGIVIPT